MKNSFGDLHNHLFEQLERLNDDGLTGEKLQEELERTKSMTSIAGRIIENGNLVLKAQMANNEYRGRIFLPGDKKNEETT